MPPQRSRAVTGSWLALVAATTLGDAAGTVRAEVRADAVSDGRTYRLVVQSYDGSDGALPGHGARPIGSVQRAVTADELRQGVNVDLVEIHGSGVHPVVQAPVVVAWIEAGQPDLEFEGLTARPQPGSVYGFARRSARQEVVQISLDRRA